MDDDGTQLVNDHGRELLPDPEREVSEDEALEIVNYATSYRNTRKGLRNAQTGRNYFRLKKDGGMKSIKKVNTKTKLKFRKFNPKRPPNRTNKSTPFNKKYGNNKRITGKQLLKNIKCHTCKQKGHMSRNCPENQKVAKRESRPARHKAQIAPNTALYEILELN